MEKKKLIDIFHSALKSFNLPSKDEDYPLNVVLKGSLKQIKSFQLVLFLMEVESKIEVEVDLFDLVESMEVDICVRDLLDQLLTV